MICGTLYVVNYETLKIDYSFNTSNNIGTEIDIPVPGLTQNVSAIKYNSKDNHLYAWDNKAAVKYRLNFDPIMSLPTRPPPTTSTISVTSSTALTTTTSTLSPSEVPKKCPLTRQGGVTWPETNYQGLVQVRCPGSSYGYAHWVCRGNATHPRWNPDTPDFTHCVSGWIREIEVELNSERFSAAKLSQRFTNILRQNFENGEALNSWDVTASIRLLRAFYRNASTKEHESAALLTSSMLQTIDVLLDPLNENAWRALTSEMQEDLTIRLISTAEDTAFFLASDLSIAESPRNPGSPTELSQELVNWKEKMISAGIWVHTARAEKRDYESVNWNDGEGGLVRLDPDAIAEALEEFGITVTVINKNRNMTRRLAVVMLSFQNLGQYFKDIKLYQTQAQEVNSRIFTVSTAVIEQTKEMSEESVFVHRHSSVSLRRPVVLEIPHQRADLPYHACSFWDYSTSTKEGYWSRRGCRRVGGNSTHSTCECNHMTSFAILSSDNPFPSLGDDKITIPMKTEKEEMARSSEELSTLRIGLSISLFFLLIISATLLSLRRLQSDINTIHKNMILSLCAAEIVFSCSIDRTLVPGVCGAVAALLHFGLLATFTWAALESYHLMVLLGDVTERTDRWRWYYLFGYGIPGITVAASAAVNHAGYGTGSVCWLKTDGTFIWSFVGPCCLVIVLCIVCLTVTMCRLRMYNFTFADVSKDRNIRAGVARSCLLMFLLCSIWSCGVLWLSNFQSQVTSILFCIFSCLHGLACFLLYCFLPPEIRLHYSRCISRFSKKSKLGRRSPQSQLVSTASELRRLRSITSHGDNFQSEGREPYGEYYSTATGCTTTLLPVSSAQSALLAKAASFMENVGGSAPNIDHTRVSTLDDMRSAHQNGRCHSDGSAFDLTEETRPKIPPNSFLHPHPASSSWNEYGQTRNRRLESVTRHYEQPLPRILQCSTLSSGASGPYNHLHENYPCGSHHQLAPSTGTVPQPRNHHYETMDKPICRKCPPEYSVQVQMNGVGQPEAVRYKRCFDDVQHQKVCLTAPFPRNGNKRTACLTRESDDTGYPEECHNNVRAHGEARPGQTTSGIIYSQCPVRQQTGENQNSTKEFYSNRPTRIKMGTMGLLTPEYHGGARRLVRSDQRSANRNGRSSDPLSTDQGYDTDSHQLSCGMQSDNEPTHQTMQNINADLTANSVAKTQRENALGMDLKSRKDIPHGVRTETSRKTDKNAHRTSDSDLSDYNCNSSKARNRSDNLSVRGKNDRKKRTMEPRIILESDRKHNTQNVGLLERKGLPTSNNQSFNNSNQNLN